MALFGLIKESTLLHTGCSIGKYDNSFIRENYELLLEKLGVSFVTDKDLSMNFICGSIVLDLGFEKDFIMLARKNLRILRSNGIKRIIACCPECYKALSIDYKEFLLDWDLEVVFVLDLVAKRLKGRRLAVDIGFDATLHDPSYLGRYCGIYDSPRIILSILGFNLVEMKYSRDNSIDSGVSGALPETNPEIAGSVAVMRLNHAKNYSKNLTVVGIRDYEHFRKNEIPGVRIFEISDLICRALGLKKLEVVL